MASLDLHCTDREYLNRKWDRFNINLSNFTDTYFCIFTNGIIFLYWLFLCFCQSAITMWDKCCLVKNVLTDGIHRYLLEAWHTRGFSSGLGIHTFSSTKEQGWKDSLSNSNNSITKMPQGKLIPSRVHFYSKVTQLKCCTAPHSAQLYSSEIASG